MKRLCIFTLCSFALAVWLFTLNRRNQSIVRNGEGRIVPKPWLRANHHPITPAKDLRPPDQTFLTYPEWFLVFSPEEQASYFKKRTASSFPFMAHVAQFWESYSIVNDQIRGNFPANGGYHLMIWVIGISTTVEYSVKAWYETVIGRVTDTYDSVTEEDKFNTTFTNEYVSFIKDRPWYEFNFKSRLKRLWSETSLWGAHPLRKFERRYVLTSELLVKYVYGKIIGIGTEQVYEVALPSTAVILENDSLLHLPRYNKFAAAALGVAQSNHHFKEIAGNNSALLITFLLPATDSASLQGAQLLFTQPISSDPSQKRLAVVVPVEHLDNLLLQAQQKHIAIEHIFDY